MEHAEHTINRPAISWILLARVILGTLFAAGALALQYSGSAGVLAFKFTPIYWYAGSIYLSSIGFALSVVRRTETQASITAALSVLDLALVFGLTTYTGGSNSPFIFLYLFIIIGAAILKLRRGALIMTALSMIAISVTLVLEYYSKLPLDFLVRYRPLSSSQLLVTAFYNITAFYVVGILSSYLAERLRSASEQIDRLDLDISILKGLQDRIIDNIATGLLTLDEFGRILLANRQAEKILGVNAPRLRGAAVAGLMPGIELHERTPDSRMELSYNGPDGSVRFLGYSVSTIRIDPRRLGFIILFQDLTRMKELESAVKRQEKLAALGAMAAGIAHEIRNPLGSISGSLQLLRQNLHLRDENDQLIAIALREIDRLNALVSDFLLYARPVRRTLEQFSLHSLVEEVIGGLRADAKAAKTELVNAVPDHLRLHADPSHVRQILLNLAINAAQAAAVRVVFRARNEKDGTQVEIEDNGKGIPSETMAHLFEPFFTTRPDGVGLGLAIVYRIMDEYQGSVEAQSAPGRTVFKLWFPKESTVV